MRGIDLVLMWHMHQPDYRLVGSDGGESFVLPWTYLHAIKDYTDMAAHLERHPAMRAVVNFVPVLLDQIEDYAAQCASGRIRDPLLACLARPDLGTLSPAQRRAVASACFRSNHATMLEPYPQYRRLHELYRRANGDGDTGLAYFSAEYFSDLVAWYHLAWCGESERRQREPIARMLAKGSGFDFDDRRALLAAIGEMIGALIGRYRALADAGRIELSATPHAHPLAPLLLELSSARQSQPEAVLPRAAAYPGGRARLQVQIDAALASHASRFGAPPAGMWPAEGAISDGVIALLGEAGCRWSASSESVLANSLGRPGEAFAAERAQHLYRPYRLDGNDPLLFFRDERLSDLIGFEYSNWYGSDAAGHFVAELEQIAASAPDGERPVVAVILDGENAWEHYPYNGYYFIDRLYDELCARDWIRTTTFAELARAMPTGAARLATLQAGSWVHGTLSTWIGDADKNRAWDLLCAAKSCFDLAIASGRLDDSARAAASAQLARCESSDWFWWFGAYNPAATVTAFDRLFRAHLARLYRLLGLPPPATLDAPISVGSGDAEPGGTMRRAGASI